MAYLEYVPVGERTLTALIQDIANSQGRVHYAHELLSLACEAVGHVGPKLFDNFFTLLRNRSWAFCYDVGTWYASLHRRGMCCA